MSPANIPAAGDALARDPRWSFRGLAGNGERYVIVLPHGQRRELTPAQAATYLEWRGLADTPSGPVNPVDDGMRAVLTAPGPLDRSRIAIWHALERADLTITDLAARVGVTRKTLSTDLTLGRRQPPRKDQARIVEAVLDRALTTLGAAPILKGRRRISTPPHEGEPTALARIRAVAVAQHAGLLELDAPCGIHSAFRAFRLELTRGAHTRTVETVNAAAACAAVADAANPDVAGTITVI